MFGKNACVVVLIDDDVDGILYGDNKLLSEFVIKVDLYERDKIC